MQRLAVIARDGPCQFPGCFVSPDRCHVHHFEEWLKDQGITDVEVIGLFCPAHHQHIHLFDLVVVRELDGAISIRDRSSGALVARARKRVAAAA